MLNPLFLGLTFLLVFGVILDTRRGDPNYIGFLLSGLFPFYFTMNALSAVPGSILSNAKLLTTQQFPRMLLPISAIIEGGIGFTFSLVPYFAIIGIFGGTWPGTHTLALPIVIAIHCLFNLGIALIVAQLTIPFRDIGEVIPFLTRLWLYTSPVIFPLDDRLKNVSEALFQIFSLNPMASILDFYRFALMGRSMEARTIPQALAWTVFFLIVGGLTFRRNEKNLVKYL